MTTFCIAFYQSNLSTLWAQPCTIVIKGINRYLSTTVPPFPYDRLLLAVHIVRLDNEDNMETSREEIPADGEAGAFVHRLPEQQCCQLLPRFFG
jgi:hypothetical protein